jgi:hypothetical protein
MCRGLALGFNFDKGIKCIGVNSHTETLGKEEDKYLKLEMIVDHDSSDGYVLELDEDYSDDIVVRDLFPNCIKNGKLNKEVHDLVMKEIKKDEPKYLRWLLKNTSFARRKEGNFNNDHQITEEGDFHNSFQETKEGNFNNCSQKTEKGYINNNDQRIGEGDFYNSGQETKKGYFHNRYQKTEEGNFYNDCQITGEGDFYNINQETKKGYFHNRYQKTEEGNFYNDCQITGEGDFYNINQETRNGTIYLDYCRTSNEKTNKFIKEYSDKLAEKGKSLSLDYLVELILKKA